MVAFKTDKPCSNPTEVNSFYARNEQNLTTTTARGAAWSPSTHRSHHFVFAATTTTTNKNNNIVVDGYINRSSGYISSTSKSPFFKQKQTAASGFTWIINLFLSLSQVSSKVFLSGQSLLLRLNKLYKNFLNSGCKIRYAWCWWWWYINWTLNMGR